MILPVFQVFFTWLWISIEVVEVEAGVRLLKENVLLDIKELFQVVISVKRTEAKAQLCLPQTSSNISYKRVGYPTPRKELKKSRVAEGILDEIRFVKYSDGTLPRVPDISS